MKRLAFGMLLLLLACSDDETRPPAPGDFQAGPVAGGGVTVGDGGTNVPRDSGSTADAGACTDLSNAGALIEQLAATDAVPTGQGGSAPSGTFELTSTTIYQQLGSTPGPNGSSYRITVRIEDTTLERVVFFQSGGASFETRSKGTFSVTSPSASLLLTCPTASQEQFTYTYDGNSLTLTNLVSKESFVFAKKL